MENAARWWRDLRSLARRETWALPAAARRRLRWRHPRLAELERRYRGVGGAAVANAVWAPEFVATIDLARFRDDGPFVWQKPLPNLDEEALRLTFEHLRRSPAAILLDRLEEDGSFGARTVEAGGRRISRDLLDSVSELAFLERNTGVAHETAFRVLDIGAGYGRLAFRAVTAFQNLRWYSTDAIAVSTFLAESYLELRGVAARAPVVPLDEVEPLLERERFDLAVNVHSFSECTMEAIDWWVSRLAAAGVPRLFVVPNALGAGGREPLTNRREAMGPVFARHGYELEFSEPKYPDPETQRRGLSPTTYFLYRR
jgi:SAM-dependent methyltransferase